MKPPIAIVKEKHGDKAKLVEALEKFTGEDLWVSRKNQGKGLKHVSNAKLLRLHATFTAVKEKFGTRAKLVDEIATLENRTKDEGFKKRLLEYPVPRLWDMYKSTAKRHAPEKPAAAGAKSAGAKAPAAAKAAPTAAKKTAKKPAAKKA
jgi:hypothetical protein